MRLSQLRDWDDTATTRLACFRPPVSSHARVSLLVKTLKGGLPTSSKLGGPNAIFQAHINSTFVAMHERILNLESLIARATVSPVRAWGSEVDAQRIHQSFGRCSSISRPGSDSRSGLPVHGPGLFGPMISHTNLLVAMRVLGDKAITSASGSGFPGGFLFFLAIGGVRIGAKYYW
ncbi:hypothetical protein U1Q18_027533 [Sarracenia purpurea var. burkii]